MVKSRETNTVDLQMYECGRKWALEDLSKGIVLKKFGGFLIRALPDSIVEVLTKKYGFKYDHYNPHECLREYNRTVREYLDKVNGKGWYERFREEYDRRLKEYRESNRER